MIKKINIQVVTAVFAACIVASFFFNLLYRYDNKYNANTGISQGGIILLPDSQNSDGTLSKEITWLVQDWDFFPDQLIYPDDTAGRAESIYIGQYFSFAGFHNDESPYGIGTYRLKISGNGTYTMLIPEVFSSCIVYLNDTQITSSGSISPYEPHIQDLIFSFELYGDAEILIQTANYSHYYSGITYPPAIGSSEAINRLITIRMLFYGFLVFTSLALALFAAVIWYGSRKNKIAEENFWLGILGISFSFRLSYPFIHMLGISNGNLEYILENSMTALGLFCITRTVSLICLKKNSLPECILKGITGGFVLLGSALPSLMTKYLPEFVPVYGQILYWYKILIALVMFILLIRRLQEGTTDQITLLLAGLMIYSISLICHALYLGHYEPAYTGWFEEWSSYILILCFAARMAFRNMEIIRENHYLNLHLQEEISQKTESLSKLLYERRMLLSGFAHDLKTPITSITTFTRLVELDNDHLDEESRQYLSIIRRKITEIQKQLSTINEFTHIDSAPPAFEILDLSILLRDFYSTNKPDINVSGISFELDLKTSQPVTIYGDRQKLMSVLQNLVFNSVRFTKEGGRIRLSLSNKGNIAILIVEDNGTGISEEDLPRIFDQFFTKRTDQTGSGMGLFITKSIIIEHEGTIEAASELGKGTTFTIRLPLISP